ncbi:integrin alpha-4 isoform X1 [Gopherus flavomarginatus]|uniref:integrin alpha-4 isoform X1 n=1 Tax=Gopherus flavomarginatus TaxID=286002 RepID=UPI0021CC45AC|nr:integrin alpha-4 isoform X1 [Gopherus flavomarginatus]XP_050772362.1 integrin alpha-4 isoform X1 [Gopherus flavomarginatus]
MRGRARLPGGLASGGAPVWAALLLLLGRCMRAAHAYNLDTQRPVVFKGRSGTLFGYSVVLHSHGPSRWLVVGAPKANWLANSSVVNPGAIFRCRIGSNPSGTCEQLQMGNPAGDYCGKTCFEERDNQWLGVSLSRQPRENGTIVACGHRWKNIYYIKNEHKLPNGVCYEIPPDFRTQLSKRISPCYKDYVRKFGENHGSCQAGMSSFYYKDLIIMGAPGSYYWTGSVFVYNTTANTFQAYTDSRNQVKFGSYLGYAVGAGHFLTPASTEVIGGAPQQEQTGKAYIFSIGTRALTILSELKGKKLGSYFGAAVCAVDLNTDGLSDLLVGAPMQSKVREEGRVYVYINSGSGAKMLELEIELAGSDSYAARFGESIANLGDIDNDGFEDVAIGAPQENNLEGAIYIYNGRKDGISSSFSQRIQGHRISNTLSMFGQSISSGIDADNNGYPDVAVGAFLDDSAVLLRTRPVVIVEAFLKHPNAVNRTNLECVENGQPAVCVNLMLCFTYKGRDVPGYVVLLYDLSVDVSRKTNTPARFYFSSNGTSDMVSGSMEIYNSNVTCKSHLAFLKKDVRDILTPIHIEATYHLGHHVLRRRSVEEFPPLEPVLQQRKEKDIIKNKMVFARFCSRENCSADLNVSGKLAFPKPHEKKTYLSVGSMKTLLLNISLSNAGDDAYETALHIQLPKGLYFVRVLELEEKQIHCDISDKEAHAVRLDCSVGYLYVDHLSKMDFSFLLDASSLTRAEDDLTITVNATCKNEEYNDLLLDNSIALVIPLKHEVELNVHGSVSPASFVYGPSEENSPINCMKEKINFTFHVISAGPSLAPAIGLEIMVPNSFAPRDEKLFNILDIQTADGECFYNNYTRDCTLPEKNGHMNILEDLVIFFSKPTKRRLYCMKEDHLCLRILCKFGNMENGKEAIVRMQLEATPSVLEMDEASSLKLEISATASPEKNPKVIELHKERQIAHVFLEGLHNQKPKHHVTMLIIGTGSVLGIFLFLLIVLLLWKSGFFKRRYQPIPQEQPKEKVGT